MSNSSLTELQTANSLSLGCHAAKLAEGTVRFLFGKKETQNLSITCHSLTQCCQRNNTKKEMESEMMRVLGLRSCLRKNQEDYDWQGRGVKAAGPWVRGEGRYCPRTWPESYLRAENSEFPLFRETKIVAMVSWGSSFWSSLRVSDWPNPGTPGQIQHSRKKPHFHHRHRKTAENPRDANPGEVRDLSAPLQGGISTQRYWARFAAKCLCGANQMRISGFPLRFPAVACLQHPPGAVSRRRDQRLQP